MVMKEFIIPFTTGLSIFIFGMQVMRIGFEHLFFERIKEFLKAMTKTPLLGLLTGMIATAVLQSSSAVTLLTIALTNARYLKLKQTLGLILGANVGTCLTTELLAFRIQDLGMYFFCAGIILFCLPHLKVKSTGLVLGGFGLLFIGMDIMQSIAPLLKTLGWIQALYVYGQEGILRGVLAGTILTALIQSSSATTAITMNLMYDQLLPLTVAIAIILGSNIGTCITAVLGSMGGNRGAKQVATAHVLLNLIGVLLFIPLTAIFGSFLEWLTTNPVHQVAHAQTIFNVLCSLLFLPFIAQFERCILWVIPDKRRY